MPDISHLSDSDNESFHSFDDDEPSPPEPPPARPAEDHTRSSARRRRRSSSLSATADIKSKPVLERFPPDEEASLLAESNTLKGSGNQLFGRGSFESAIQTYDRALASCPAYLDYEVAVLRSNMAACHLKLAEWKDAVESAEKGLDCLDRLEPLPQPERKKPAAAGEGADAAATEAAAAAAEAGAERVEEIDEDVLERIERLRASGRTLDQVRKLQVKLLTRRAQARTGVGGWAALQSADEDYGLLLSPALRPALSPTDQRQLLDAARRLAPQLAAAKDREMGEMMDKLKGLGNSILNPFGLSTNNFQFTKDEQSGGYSMNFTQNPGSGSN